jgi:hypothetical protein
MLGLLVCPGERKKEFFLSPDPSPSSFSRSLESLG